jgi:hypothetical protein
MTMRNTSRNRRGRARGVEIGRVEQPSRYNTAEPPPDVPDGYVWCQSCRQVVPKRGDGTPKAHRVGKGGHLCAAVDSRVRTHVEQKPDGPCPLGCGMVVVLRKDGTPLRHHLTRYHPDAG